MSDNLKILHGKKTLITGGLGFIGSNLAYRLVSLGAEVTLIDSLIPEYGGNLHNVKPINDKVHGIRSCSLRLTNTYGPRMRIKDARQTFLGVWIRNILRGEPLKVFGDGKQIRDFNYVDDVVDALLIAAVCEESAGKIYNLG